MRPILPARSEQKQSVERHPLYACAGRDAAEFWLIAPPLSMADFRDLPFRNFVASLDARDDYAGRRDAFNEAFAHRIALAISSASRPA